MHAVLAVEVAQCQLASCVMFSTITLLCGIWHVQLLPQHSQAVHMGFESSCLVLRLDMLHHWCCYQGESLWFSLGAAGY